MLNTGGGGLNTPLLIPSESHQNTMKMKTCGNMYTKIQNPKLQNHSYKTLEIRPLQSFAYMVSDFRHKSPKITENKSQQPENGHQTLTVIGRMLYFFSKEA